MDIRDDLQAKYPIHFSGPRGIECGVGWAPLIEAFIQELDALPGGPDLVFFSIKEKFGDIRIDIEEWPPGIDTKAVYALISQYEQKSMVTCELCGKPGKKRPGGWIKTLCDDHNP